MHTASLQAAEPRAHVRGTMPPEQDSIRFFQSAGVTLSIGHPFTFKWSFGRDAAMCPRLVEQRVWKIPAHFHLKTVARAPGRPLPLERRNGYEGR